MSKKTRPAWPIVIAGTTIENLEALAIYQITHRKEVAKYQKKLATYTRTI